MNTRSGPGTAWALLALMALAAGACTGNERGAPSPARFTEVRCPADVAEALPELNVTCGFLRVPERRADPEDGTIEVFVARVRGPDPVLADPLIVIGGTDIGAPVHYAEDIAAKQHKVGREVIVVEPRGTGHARPSLACPEIDAFDRGHVGRSVANDEVASAFTPAVRACARHLRGRGVDLGAYTLEESAADVSDLVTALGLGAFNVEAIGYNAKIAFDLLRRSPPGLRSMYLVSPVYPDQTLFGLAIDGTRSALEAFSHACDARPACHGVLPSVARAADDSVGALQRHPSAVRALGSTVELDAMAAARALRDLMAFAPGTVPTEVADLAAGDTADVAAYVASQRPSCFGYRSFCRMTDPPASWGEVLSILCHDDASLASASVDAPSSSLPGQLAHHPYLDACQAWPAGRSQAHDPMSPRTDVPILLLHGEFDPFSMAPDEATLSSMSHAYMYVLTGQSTNPLGRGEEGCAQAIRLAFVTDPTSAPDTTCLGTLEAPRFAP